jgi:hypothetical protein
MRADLTVLGPAYTRKRHIAASSTRIEYGEPVYSTATLTNGVASSNEWVLAAADFPVLGTHTFGGVALKGTLPFKTGTVVAQYLNCACPIPEAGIIRGKAETVANADTAAELLGLIGDVTLVDYNSTGGSDGGELYTIKETASADTSGFQIVDGNTTRGTLDVEVYATAYRTDQDVT